MKKLLLTVMLGLTAALLSTTPCAFGAISNVALSFNDNSGTPNAGTYNSNDAFNVDVFLSFSADASNPNMLKGLSFWLETETGAASHLTLTGETYSTITSQTDPGFPKTFTASAGADSGFLASHDTVPNPNTGNVETGDLGGTFPLQSAGTFKVANLQFSIAGLAPGTYHIETTHNISQTGGISALTSEATDNNPNPSLTDNPIPQSIYTFTVVPEPATWSLLGLGGIGSFGLTWLRARRRS
jgi:hypothetical protein